MKHNIIWNKEELKRIRIIILNKANLTIDEDGKLIEKVAHSNFYLYNGLPLFRQYHQELEGLFHTQDRDLIKDVLTKASMVQADLKNNLHFGLIASLSKINPNNHYEIFFIFKELIALYEHTIHKYAEIDLKPINDIEEIRERIEIFKTYDGITETEGKIISELSLILKQTNTVSESKLFKPLIEKLNNSIKSRLLEKYKQILNSKARTKEEIEKEISKEHSREFQKKYIRRNLNTLKQKNLPIYKI